MVKRKISTTKEVNWKWTEGISFRTILPIFLVALAISTIFSLSLSEQIKGRTKNYLIQKTLLPHFSVLASEKDADFGDIKKLSELTAKKVSSRLSAGSHKSEQEINEQFSRFYTHQPDGSYRSTRDEGRGRFQIAGFHNNRIPPDLTSKIILNDAFQYFESFSEGIMTTVHDCYFTRENAIWIYGAPDWPLTVPADETFDKYNWFYEAKPEHNPSLEHVWTDMYFDKVQGEWMVSSLMPVMKGNQFIGTLGQDLILKKIIKFTQRAPQSSLGSKKQLMFFVDQHGNIIAHPETLSLLAKDAANDEKINIKSLPDKALTDTLQHLPGDKGVTLTVETNKRIVLYEKLASIDWKLILVVPENELLSIVETATMQFMASFVILASILIAVVISVIHVVVTKPTRNLAGQMASMNFSNLGEKDYRSEIEIPRKGEISFLAKNFAVLVNSLQTSATTLAESEKRQRDLLNNTSSVIYIKDISGAYLFINRMYEEVFKRRNETITGLTDYDIFPKDLADVFQANDRKVLESGKLIEFEEDAKQEDGNHHYISVKFPLRDSQNKIYAICGISTDITERKHQEAELKHLRNYLSNIIDSMPSVLVGVDQDNKVGLWNKTAEQLTEVAATDAYGKSITDVMPALIPEIENIAQSIRTGQPTQKRTKSSAPSGETRYDDITIYPLKTEGAVIRIDDVTNHILTERELEKVRKLESIGVLAGGIAHDFNNILAAILGNINLSLKDAELKERTKRLLQDAEKASIRAKGLTLQLLTFAKGGEPVKEVSSLQDIIQDSANFVLRGDKVACTFSIPQDLWLVDVDKGQISQVIQNIVLNASHAMPEGGTITIACDNIINDNIGMVDLPKGRLVKIEIHDEGLGMSADIVEKIFDPYFSTRPDGSGLGLAITHSIVAKHGGHIAVESMPGDGTTFTIYLPAAEQQHSTDLGKEELYSTPSIKILLMDDDEMVATTVSLMLQELGHETVFATDGEMALNHYKAALDTAKPFDLVIMDITIPGGMGGEKAVQKVLELDPAAKVIVASGYSNDPIMANYSDYGFCAALSKPFRLEELSKTINDLLD